MISYHPKGPLCDHQKPEKTSSSDYRRLYEYALALEEERESIESALRAWAANVDYVTNQNTFFKRLCLGLSILLSIVLFTK